MCIRDRSIPVINQEKNELVGIITESDLFKAYLDLNKQVRDLKQVLEIKFLMKSNFELFS